MSDKIENDKKEFRKTANELLDKYNVPLGTKMAIRRHIILSSGLNEEHPFIKSEKTYMDSGEIKTLYYSEHVKIKHMIFESLNEVVLANAIFINMDDKIDVNEFKQLVKFTFRMIGCKSKWTE